jgi:hypothetical protein
VLVLDPDTLNLKLLRGREEHKYGLHTSEKPSGITIQYCRPIISSNFQYPSKDEIDESHRHPAVGESCELQKMFLAESVAD